MTGKEAYKIYAPEGVNWTQWVRPVPFVAIDTYNREPVADWVDRTIMFLEEYEPNTAIFIDFRGKESIEFGIAFAKLGYRPIPIFNGTDEQEGATRTTDSYLVESSLINGAEQLKSICINKDANPAFLLDNDRLDRYRAKESIFDNSWDLYGQDIPSLEYFKQNNIHKILVIGNEVHRDLRKIFLKFQKEGISIYLSNGYLPAKKVILRKTLKERLEKEEL